MDNEKFYDVMDDSIPKEIKDALIERARNQISKESILWDTLKTNDLELFKSVCLESGLDFISVEDEFDNTLLMTAADNNQYEIVKWLLEEGSNPNHENFFESSAISRIEYEKEKNKEYSEEMLSLLKRYE